MMFRALRADEVELRVSQINDKGASLLLYKDARCDQNILDETVGAMNWQRFHSRDNANCTVSIWDESKGQWVAKEDTGTESNTEKEKGLASDSFKRACFNWGIGRELYTAPFIWIPTAAYDSYDKNGKKQMSLNNKLAVDKMTVENGVITALEISNTRNGKKQTVYTYGNIAKATPQPAPKAETRRVLCGVCGRPLEGAALQTADRLYKKYGTYLCGPSCRDKWLAETQPIYTEEPMQLPFGEDN